MRKKLLTAELNSSKNDAMSKHGEREEKPAKTKHFVVFVTEMQCIIYAFLRFSGFMCAFLLSSHRHVSHFTPQKQATFSFPWNKQRVE